MSDLLLFIAQIENVFLEILSPAAKKFNKSHEKMTSIVVFDLLGNIIWWIGLIYVIVWYFF